MVVSSKGLFLNQQKYILDLLEDAKMIDSKPALTPLDSKLKLDTTSAPLQAINDYHRLVGKLIYLTIARPDITYVVSLASQFMHVPTVFHLGIVKRILRYLKGSIGCGIVLTKNGHTQITGYNDSNWVGNALDRKSTTGFCMFVSDNLVAWRSKKQHVVAQSSAMASTTCEMIWIKGLLTNLGFPSSLPMTPFCDNQVAMKIASKSCFL